MVNSLVVKSYKFVYTPGIGWFTGYQDFVTNGTVTSITAINTVASGIYYVLLTYGDLVEMTEFSDEGGAYGLYTLIPLTELVEGIKYLSMISFQSNAVFGIATTNDTFYIYQ